MKTEVTFVDGALVRAGVGICNSDSDDFPEGWRNPPWWFVHLLQLLAGVGGRRIRRSRRSPL